MNGSKTGSPRSMTMLPGLLIGGGAGLLVAGAGLLRLALTARPFEVEYPDGTRQPVGDDRHLLWVGPVVLVAGAALLVAGWRWLRGLAARRAGREALADGLLGVFVVYTCVLASRARWDEVVGLGLSVAIVFVIAGSAGRRAGAGPSERGATDNGGA
jgi:hypothetical protein